MSCVKSATRRVFAIVLSVVMLFTGAMPTMANTIDFGSLTGENPDSVFSGGNAPSQTSQSDSDFVFIGGDESKEALDETDPNEKPTPLGESGVATPTSFTVETVTHTLNLKEVTVGADGNIIEKGGISLFAIDFGDVVSISEKKLYEYAYNFGNSTWPANDFFRGEYFSVISHTVDGTPKALYCLEPNVAISDGSGYTATQTWNALTATQKTNILKVLLAGEKNPNNTSGVLATQTLIWEAMMEPYGVTVGGKGFVYQGVLLPHNAHAQFGGAAINPPAAAATAYDTIWAAAQAVTIGDNQLMYLTKMGSQTVVTGAEGGDEGTYVLKIIKKDKADEKLLPDAVFSITGPNGFSRTGLKTNASGEISVSLVDVGTYTVTETTPPPGYEDASPKSQPVNVTLANVFGNPAEVTFKNTKKSTIPDDEPGPGEAIGQVTIIKQDGGGKPLPDAVFRIEVKFSNGQTVVNERFQVKNGSDTYHYKHPADDTSVATVTVTEVEAPVGYVADSRPQVVSIRPTWADGDGKLTMGDVDASFHLTFVNEEAQASLRIYKYEKGNKGIALPGAQFEIFYADPNVSAQRWNLTTDDSGYIEIDLPRAGTIVVREKVAPVGYVIAKDPVTGNTLAETTVVIEKGENKLVEIANDKKGAVIVYKKDSVDGRLLSGATFKIRGVNVVGYEDYKTTDSSGFVTFFDLIPGTYEVTEETPPQYYDGTTKSFAVEIKDDSYETIELTFENDPWTGLRIIKVDSKTSARLQGAIFALYRGSDLNAEGFPTGEFVSDYESNANGEVLIRNLSPGPYVIVERQPPSGYAISSNPVRAITIDPLDPNRELQVIYQNDELPKLRIIKRDRKTNALLPGATFQLRHEDGSTYDDIMTSSDGTVLIDKLPIGWYTITEMRQPTGYLMPTEAIAPVELVAGKTTEIVVYNDKMPALILKKIDSVTKLPLPNATFKVTKQGAMEFTTIKSDDKGIAQISGLEAGHYIVEEIFAPTGYVKIEEPFVIEMKPGIDTEITIENIKVATLLIKKIDNIIEFSRYGFRSFNL